MSYVRAKWIPNSVALLTFLLTQSLPNRLPNGLWMSFPVPMEMRSGKTRKESGEDWSGVWKIILYDERAFWLHFVRVFVWRTFAAGFVLLALFVVCVWVSDTTSCCLRVYVSLTISKPSETSWHAFRGWKSSFDRSARTWNDRPTKEQMMEPKSRIHKHVSFAVSSYNRSFVIEG